jgi:hypothetical protein
MPPIRQVTDRGIFDWGFRIFKSAIRNLKSEIITKTYPYWGPAGMTERGELLTIHS